VGIVNPVSRSEGAAPLPEASDPTHGDRLGDLEVAEEARASSRRLDRRFELFEAVLLSIAALLAAWAGFQSAKWSGVQANSYSQAGASRVESTRSSTLAGQQSTVDVITFTQWLEAAESEGLLDAPPDPGSPYEPDPTQLSGFLYERFRPEFATAVEAWVATQPRIDPDAPPTPFAMQEYEVAAALDASRLEAEAEGHAANARQANQRSDNYVLMTIMFATVLFFAGISSKMDTFRARALLLGVGTTLLLVAIAVVISFPKEI
jgi:hypothetical protein